MSMSTLPRHLIAAYGWIDAAGEWQEALTDASYPTDAARNARAHDALDVTESELLEVIGWYRENRT